MKSLLIALVLAGTSSAAGAVAVEFNVPVEVQKVTESATHVEVTCGSWDNVPGSRRFLQSETVRVPLQTGVKNKFHSGIVKVVVPFPGASVPTGTYRCTMAMRTAQGLAAFDSQPAAPRTAVVTEVIGNFNELNFQQGTSATVKPPAAPLLPPKQPPSLTHK
jgi:hypothetical protein